MSWSKYQEAIFDFGRNGDGNGCIQACAGAGKTTTGMELIKTFVGEGRFCSFTNIIVNELKNRIQAQGIRNVRSQTYNSYGAGLIFKNMKPAPRLLTEKDEKASTILRHVVLANYLHNDEDKKTYNTVRYSVSRLVSLFRSLAIMTVAEAEQRFEEIVDYYDIDLPKMDRGKYKEILFRVWHVCLTGYEIMDFQDQVFFPVLLNWNIPQVDFLVIDEYQDTCPIEAELMFRSCRRGRKVVFGDSWQAIYNFKGTKPDSMGQFAKDWSAKELPLSISYRCSRAVVHEAQSIVKHIESAPNAKEGSVGWANKEEFHKRVSDNDMVIARCTDDLVRSVMRFLAAGRAAFVVGREFGTQLNYLIEKLCAGMGDFMDSSRFVDILDAHFNTEHPMLLKQGKESQALNLESKVESLKVLILGCSTVNDLRKKIGTIFTDSGNGIRHMTIHKAKGLESTNVWVLRADKLPHPKAKKPHLLQEEERLRYVAITRAKENLTYVEK